MIVCWSYESNQTSKANEYLFKTSLIASCKNQFSVEQISLCFILNILMSVSETQTLNDTEIKMRFKNAFVTFLPWAGSIQWTVHENKALYSYPGRVYSERFLYSGNLRGSLGVLIGFWPKKNPQVIAIQQDQISNVSSGTHRHHTPQTRKWNMVGRTTNVGQLTCQLTRLHGATLQIQIKDGTGAIAMIQIQRVIFMWSWVIRLLRKHGGIYFTRRMDRLNSGIRNRHNFFLWPIFYIKKLELIQWVMLILPI